MIDGLIACSHLDPRNVGNILLRTISWRSVTLQLATTNQAKVQVCDGDGSDVESLEEVDVSKDTTMICCGINCIRCRMQLKISPGREKINSWRDVIFDES